MSNPLDDYLKVGFSEEEAAKLHEAGIPADIAAVLLLRIDALSVADVAKALSKPARVSDEDLVPGISRFYDPDWPEVPGEL